MPAVEAFDTNRSPRIIHILYICNCAVSETAQKLSVFSFAYGLLFALFVLFFLVVVVYAKVFIAMCLTNRISNEEKT